MLRLLVIEAGVNGRLLRLKPLCFPAENLFIALQSTCRITICERLSRSQINMLRCISHLRHLQRIFKIHFQDCVRSSVFFKYSLKYNKTYISHDKFNILIFFLKSRLSLFSPHSCKKKSTIDTAVAINRLVPRVPHTVSLAAFYSHGRHATSLPTKGYA